MKIKNIACIFVGVISLLCLSPAYADSVTNWVNKYYPSLKANETDGTGQMGILHNFFKEIPADSQADVLAGILEQASSSTPPDYILIDNMLNVALGFQDKKITWNNRLQQLIYAQAKSPDPNVRGMVAHLLAKTRKDDARDLILSFLDDPDEAVRCKALDSIDGWPDAETIYKKYIQTHQGDVSYSKSLKYAQDNLDAIHQKTQ